MLFNLWSKFKKSLTPNAAPSQGSDKTGTVVKSEKIDVASSFPNNPSLSDIKASVTRTFEQNELETLQMNTVFSNLNELKKLVDQPKEAAPELRFSKINQHLTSAECHETFRQERWPVKIHCPYCLSTNIKRIPQLPTLDPNKHRYRCLDCNSDFNDDSETSLEHAVPSLNVWMQCWYLMGCTESLSYIAKKLGIELATVESMALQLQKTFQSKHPLTRFVGYTEWSKQSQQLRKQLKEDLLLQYERLNADIATAPKDTVEHRRQSILRRELKPSILPPNTGGKKR